ncbi:MAG: hypothetical protein ACYDCS_09335 [Candidatus Dormibacteria bacterium]
MASLVLEYRRRRYITDPAHVPASQRAHREWTPTRLIRWARTVGPAAAGVEGSWRAGRLPSTATAAAGG